MTNVTPAKPKDFGTAITHLKAVSDEMIEKYEGKDGMNPHLFIAEHIKPLLLELSSASGRTDSNYDKAMSIKVTEPTVDLTNGQYIKIIKPVPQPLPTVLN